MKKNESLFFFKHLPTTGELTEIVCLEADVEPLYLAARDIIRIEAGFKLDKPNFGKIKRWMDATGKTLLLRYEKRIGGGKAEVIEVPIYPNVAHEITPDNMVLLLAKDSITKDVGDGSLRIVADLLDADYRTKLTDEGLIDHTNYSPSYDDFVVADILADFIKKLDQEPNLDVKEALRTYFSKEPNYYLDEGWKGGWACGYRDNAYELDITEIFLSAMEEAVRARDSDPEHFADLYFGPRFSRTKEYEELSKQIDVWEDELWHIELFRD